jgi:hypothetical protein
LYAGGDAPEMAAFSVAACAVSEATRDQLQQARPV